MKTKKSIELMDSPIKNPHQKTGSTFYSEQNKFRPFKLLPSPTKKSYTEQSTNRDLHFKKENRKLREKMFEQSFDEKQHQDDEIEYKARTITPHTTQASKIYRDIYRKIDNVLEKKQIYGTMRSTLYSSMLQKSESEQLLPRKLGMIRPQNKKILDASNYRMGDKYAKVLVEGVKHHSDFYELVNLKNNNLTSVIGEQLQLLIPTKVKQLDLEGNSLGNQQKSSEFLKSLNTRFGQLQFLNLENNRFNDISAKCLFISVQENPKITRLNLSRNLLTDQCTIDLRDLLIKNNTIIELYLHWNRLHSQGGFNILQGLQQNQTLKVLDLSYNQLGVSKDEQNQKKYNPIQWGEYLGSKQCCLIHLDLSNNQFSVQIAESISKNLEQNHTLYGFHYSGNSNTQIDYMGFLIAQQQMPVDDQDLKSIILKKDEDFQTQTPGALNHRRINSVQALRAQTHNSNEICWICDGWVEYQFIWSPGHIDMKKEPIYIHLSHERFAPIKMEPLDEECGPSPLSLKQSHKQKIWVVSRMVPSKQKISFFFSSPLLRQCSVSAKYSIIPVPLEEQSKKVLFYTINGNVIKLNRPKQYNQISLQNSQIIDEFSHEPNVQCQPRIKETKLLEIEIEQEEDVVIQLEDFFKDCHRDNDDDYIQCFDTDWLKSSISKLLKDDQEDVKSYLRHIYKDLVSAYKYMSAVSPSGDIWCIPLNQYTEIFQCVIDKNYFQKDLDIIFKQCTSKYNSETRNTTAHALIRYQFMEILVRVALDKHKALTPLEAVQKLYENDGLQKKIEQIPEPQIWRDDIYWSRECNQIIQQNMIALKQLFELCVNLRQLTYFTTKQFVTPSSFKELFNRAKLINDSNYERNIFVGYALSMQLNPDEVGSDRAMQMNFNEFVEALARVAEKIGSQKQKITSEILAYRIQQLIQTLSQYYEIVVQLEQKQPAPNFHRILQKKRTTFLQSNANYVLYEMEESARLDDQ